MTDSLPAALKYGASSSSARVVRQTIMPVGNSTGTTSQQSTFRWKLPEKALLDLRSLSFYYDYSVSGLVDHAADYSNALIPAAYKHFSQVRFYVSSAIASGGMANHYDIGYHALVRASGSEDWVNSRWNNGLVEVLLGADANGTNDISARPNADTTRTAHFTYDDILGLPNSKNFVLDTSLFGTCEVELTMASNASIKVAVAGNYTSASASAAVIGTISNIKCALDVVTAISPLYVSLLAERLQVDTPIRVPFQNIVTHVVSNTGSNRFTLNSSCVDALVVCPMNADPNAFAAIASGSAQAQLNNNRYKFDSARTLANANAGLFQVAVGAEVFGRQPVRIDECADLTTNAMHGNSAKSTNLLFAGLSAGAQSYGRLKYLTENCVIIQKFGLENEGWASGSLQGINCAGVSTDFVIQTSNLSSHLFVCALLTSQLVFSPATSAVSIEQ